MKRADLRSLGILCCASFMAFIPSALLAGSSSSGDHGHHDPFPLILVQLGLLILAAAFGRWAAEVLRKPGVLGELALGVLIGNVGYWLGIPFFQALMHLGDVVEITSTVFRVGCSMADAAGKVFSPAEMAEGGRGHLLLDILTGPGGRETTLLLISIWLFSNLGVILLLFVVGLETDLDDMLSVGPVATIVAIVGVVVPSALGFLCSKWFLPKEPMEVHLFVGAILCATSVGITARVLKDLARLGTREARVILGAAVIDDVLGLIVLAVVAGIVETGRLDLGAAGRITLSAVIFLAGVVWLGSRLIARAVPPLSRAFGPQAKLLLPLCAAFIVSWLANFVGLASIIGAFAAGLILHEGLFPHSPIGEPTRTMENFVQPLEAIFAPVFFVLVGMQVNLAEFFDPGTVALAAAFTVVAIGGKLACGLVCGKSVDALTVGFGMVPRGEVGLIFASVGKAMGVVSPKIFSAMVVMVMATTFVTPVLLKWSLGRLDRRAGAA